MSEASEALGSFLYPQANYHGDCLPEVNKEMQDFSNLVLYQVNLETNGKITCEEAYQNIKAGYKKLKKVKKLCNGEEK